jgi:hypothetical protein
METALVSKAIISLTLPMMAVRFYAPALYILDAVFGFTGFIFALPGADVFTVLLPAAVGIPLRKVLRKPETP